MDTNGFSDPYIAVQMHPDRSGRTKKKTKTIQKNLNPVFNETITLWAIWSCYNDNSYSSFLAVSFSHRTGINVCWLRSGIGIARHATISWDRSHLVWRSCRRSPLTAGTSFSLRSRASTTTYPAWMSSTIWHVCGMKCRWVSPTFDSFPSLREVPSTPARA